MHSHYIEDARGDLVDIIPFCSDSCHRQWHQDASEPYEGWNGAGESEFNEWCQQCGVIIGGSAEDDCGHLYPVVVNLIGIPEDVYCEHGTLIRSALTYEHKV